MIQKIIVDFYAIREQWKHATFNLCKIIKTIEEKNDTLVFISLMNMWINTLSLCGRIYPHIHWLHSLKEINWKLVLMFLLPIKPLLIE